MTPKKARVMLIMLLSANAFAENADLLSVYRQALDSDPTFKAAYSTFLSKSEAIPQARATLLPQLNMSAQQYRNQLIIQGGSFAGTQTYNSLQMTLNASQTIFNLQAWNTIQQAKASVKAAHAQFNDAAQNLIIRVTQAYLDILLSKDTLNFAEAKKRANKRQLDQAQQRFNVGVDTITSVYEAKAAYDQSIAQVISAHNNQINKNENLRKLTNVVYDQVSPLHNGTIPLSKPVPNNVDDWVATGLNQNYKLFSAKYNLQAARENIKVQSTGMWPTLALQATSNKAIAETPGNNYYAPSGQTQSSVSLALNFPAYQGGISESQTRQAQYDFQTSSEQLEQVFRDVVVNSRIAFNTIMDGRSKIKADRQTVASQKNSLESTEAQYQVGTRTMVDVVQAQQKLFESQEQLATDQYSFIMSMLNLKYLAGSLSVADVEKINGWLNTAKFNLPSQHS